MDQAEVAILVATEIGYADAKYGPFTSTHEGYGVLAEEVGELLKAIQSNNLTDVQRESCQVAAVAQRIALSLTVQATRNRSRGACEASDDTTQE
jgi:NTP pyrophosphatase (non-canonical NTP hydrolase)